MMLLKNILPLLVAIILSRAIPVEAFSSPSAAMNHNSIWSNDKKGTSTRIARSRRSGCNPRLKCIPPSSKTLLLASSSNRYKPRYSNRRRLPTFVQTIIFQWRRLRQFFRYLLYRNTVYVLECENDKYYVGSTKHKRQRYRQHFDQKRGGSAWTRLHKPMNVIKEYTRIPARYLMGMEAQVTSEYMIKKGVNNVRGASFSMVKDFSSSDIATLTGFLGHYNQLNYQQLYKELKKQLPSNPQLSLSQQQQLSSYNKKKRIASSFSKTSDNNESSSRKHRNYKRKMRKKMRALNKERDVCYLCGEKGHWAHECPNRKFDDKLDTLNLVDDDSPSSASLSSINGSSSPSSLSSSTTDWSSINNTEEIFASPSPSSSSLSSTDWSDIVGAEDLCA